MDRSAAIAAIFVAIFAAATAFAQEPASATEAKDAASVQSVTDLPTAAGFNGGGGGGDVLNENGFFGIPPGMTYEEYRDATRRITVGVLLMSVPVPGMLHFYANERTTGWVLVGTAAGGLAAIIAGAAMGVGSEKDEYEDTDYEKVLIYNKKYVRVPVRQEDEGGNVKTIYALQELKRKEEAGGGIAFIGIGVLAIVGSILYDWVDGIWTIEEKRDKVRYKYGIELGKTGASLAPIYDPKTNQAYLGLGYSFN